MAAGASPRTRRRTAVGDEGADLDEPAHRPRRRAPAPGDRHAPGQGACRSRGSGSRRSPTSRRRPTSATPRSGSASSAAGRIAPRPLRALQASMGFVRHELGKRLRIKRIPALHVHLDDSAERGTRVLHLLQELEAGVEPDEITPFNESLPTPVKRLPHEGDAEPVEGEARPGTLRRDPARTRRPQAADPARIGSPPRTGREAPRPARRAARPGAGQRMSAAVDLRPSPATPSRTPVLERAPRGPQRAGRQPRAPGCRHARAPCSAICLLVEAHGRPRDRRLHGSRCRRCTASCPGSTGSARIPTRRRPTTSLVLARLRDRPSGSGTWPLATPSCSPRLPRVIIDHHASNDAAGDADWIDPGAAATCELVALLAVRLGLPLDLGDGALADALMAGIVMDTATFAHPNATPRTLRGRRRRSSRPARRCRTSRAACTGRSPTPSSGCSAGCSTASRPRPTGG